MKIARKLIALVFAASLSSSVFAIDGFMHDAFIWVSSHVKDFSETTIRQNIADGRLVNPSPLDLKVGDIFIDINGHAKQVKKITKVGNNITIDAVEPELYNVVEALQIPEQTADFKAAMDEIVENIVPERTAGEKSYDRVSDKLLDDVMPSPDHRLNFTITIPIKTLQSSSNFDDKLDNLTKAAESQHTDKKQKQVIENFKQQLSNKASSKETTVSASIPLDFRWSATKNKSNYSFEYAKTGVDTHGTWKFWKWTTWYKPGYVNYNWLDDTEFGFSLGAQIVLATTKTVPIVTTGSTVAGPYAGIYFEIGGSCSVGFDYQHYSRKMTEITAFSNFNFLFIPSNTKTTKKEWAPSIYQWNIFFSGNFSVGVTPKAGLVALGLNLVELSAPLGVNVDGIIGGQYTSKSMDEKNNFANITTSINGKKYDEIGNGWALLADAKLSFFFNINLNLLNGIISTTIFDFSLPILSVNGFDFTPGFTTPFGSL